MVVKVGDLTCKFMSRASFARIPYWPFHENWWYLLGCGGVGGMGSGGGVGGNSGGSNSASTHVQESYDGVGVGG